MSQFWNLVVFSVLLSLSHCLDNGAVLQLDKCDLQKVVTDILTDKDILSKMAQSPAAKKALGKKGASPVKGISKVKVEDIKFSDISLELLPGTGIRMSVNNKIFITGKSFLGGKTELRMEVNIISYTGFEYNSSCPRFVATECKTNLINVKANLPKGILPNVMNSFLDKNLKTLLPATLCPAVDVILTMINEKLCMKNAHFSIGKAGSLDYLMPHMPTVTEQHIDIELNVTVQHGNVIIQPRNSKDDPVKPTESSNHPTERSKHPTESSNHPTESSEDDYIDSDENYDDGEDDDDYIDPSESPEDELVRPSQDSGGGNVPPTESSKDHSALPSNHGETTLLLTDEFLGCAFTALQQEGAFNLKVTQRELTKAGAMSATDLSAKIPKFPTKLQDFKIAINVDEPTMVTLDSSHAILHIYSKFEAFLSDKKSIFVIKLHMNYKIQFSADEKILHSDVSLDKIFPSLVSTSIKSLDVEDLKEFIASLLRKVYTPALNSVLKSAIRLPDIVSMLSINVAKAHVHMEKNFLMLSVNGCRA